MGRHRQHRRKAGLWACCCTAAAALLTTPVWGQQQQQADTVAATAAAASPSIVLKRMAPLAREPQQPTDKAASPSLRGAVTGKQQQDDGGAAALSSVAGGMGGYYAVLEFEGEQRLLAMIDTASPSLSVPVMPAAATPASLAGAKKAVGGVDCSSQHPGMVGMARGWGLQLQGAKARPLPCSDDRCVGTCIPSEQPAPGSNGGCSPLGGSCNAQDQYCTFEWGSSSLAASHPPRPAGMMGGNDGAATAVGAGGVLMEANLRVGPVSVSPATFGAIGGGTGDAASSLSGGQGVEAVLGLSFGNYSLCPPHTTCTRPLLDQMLLQQPGVVQDRFSLCMDGEAGALVLGRFERGLSQGGRVLGTVPLVEPFRHYWVAVAGLRLGNVSIAPELFNPSPPNGNGEAAFGGSSSMRGGSMDRDGEGCANSTTTTAASNAMAAAADNATTTITAQKQGGSSSGEGAVPSWVRQPGGGPGQWGVVSRALVDTGSSDVRLPAPLFDALRRHCEDSPAHRQALPALAGTRTYNLFDGFAVRISDEELSRMPSLEVELDLGVALVLPPSRYLRLSQVVVESGDGTGGAYYTLRVVREDHFVLGLAALEGHYLEVDRSARTLSVGLAQPACNPTIATP